MYEVRAAQKKQWLRILGWDWEKPHLQSVRSRRENSAAEEKEEVDRHISTRSVDPRSMTSTFNQVALFRFVNWHHASALNDEMYWFSPRLARLALVNFWQKSVGCRRENSAAEEKEEVDRLASTRSIDPRSMTSTSMEEALFRFLNGHHPSALK
jgi:hypothetical protein